MGVKSQKTIQLVTLFNRSVNQACKLFNLSFLLFKVPKPAGGLDTANFPANICFQILNLLFIGQPSVPAQISEDVIKINTTSVENAGIDPKGLAIFHSVIFTASATTSLSCRGW